MHRFIAIFAALIIVVGLGFGFIVLRSRLTPKRQLQTSPAPTPSEVQVQVFQDDIVLRDNHALVGGTIHNSSNRKLENLILDFEFTSGDPNKKEVERIKHSIAVEPDELQPASEGRYLLKLPAGRWSGARLVSVRSAENIALNFRTAEGKRRPVAPPPVSEKIVVVKPRPRPKAGEEFINTPETAYEMK